MVSIVLTMRSLFITCLGHSPMQSIVLFLRSRSIDVRIAAAYWCVHHQWFGALSLKSFSLTNLIRSQNHHCTRDNVTVLAVIHALNNLILTKDESQPVRMRACFVLCWCTKEPPCYHSLTQILSAFISGRFGHHPNGRPMWHPHFPPSIT